MVGGLYSSSSRNSSCRICVTIRQPTGPALMGIAIMSLCQLCPSLAGPGLADLCGRLHHSKASTGLCAVHQDHIAAFNRFVE